MISAIIECAAAGCCRFYHNVVNMIFIASVNILVSSCVQAGVVTAEVVRSPQTCDVLDSFTTWRLPALLSSF